MESWIVALIGIAAGLISGAVGVYVALRIGLVEVNGKVANLQVQRDAEIVQIGKIEQWQKDKERHDESFRIHEYTRAITDINEKLWPLDERVKAMDKRMDSLHEWKHLVGEAYLPRAVDDHHRRLDRLESKVFNGNRP